MTTQAQTDAERDFDFLLNEMSRYGMRDYKEIDTIRHALKQSAQVEGLRRALDSISRNTCCDKCQEAALVAQSALNAFKDGKEGTK